MRSSPDLVRPNMGISSDDDLPHNCGTHIINLILLGRTGAGKSALGNTILGREAFISKKSPTCVTQDVAVESGAFDGLLITVYDTPGFYGTESKEELLKYEDVLQKCESGPFVFLLVIKAGRFTEEDQETVEKIEELLGEKHIKNTWILFTGGDELEEENKTINQLISETESLKKCTQKYEGRFHVINNKTKQPTDQVKSLIYKVFQKKKGSVSKRQSIPISIQDTPVSSFPSMRIVLLGKTGVGKSAAGNTILGENVFKSVMSLFTVTHKSSEKNTTVSGRSVSVVDTPGLFDTHMNPTQLVTEIMRSVYLSSPGPHAFLIVFNVNMRFTEHEVQILQQIEMMFGQEVLKYSIILFTHGDLIGSSIEKFIEENRRLRDLVDQCGGRFHIFNNRDENNREQVNDLLQKIDTMIEQNGGGHYSNEMYEDAQRFRQEEEEQRQREEEEQRQREEEQRILQEKQTQEKIVRMIKKIGAEFEAQKRLETERRKAKIQSRMEDTTVMRCTKMLRDSDERKKEQRLREEEQRQREEEQRILQEKQTQEKIVRMIKKIGAEFEAQKRLETERRKAKIQSEEEGAIVNFSLFCPSIRSTLNESHCSRFCIWWSFD